MAMVMNSGYSMGLRVEGERASMKGSVKLPVCMPVPPCNVDAALFLLTAAGLSLARDSLVPGSNPLDDLMAVSSPMVDAPDVVVPSLLLFRFNCSFDFCFVDIDYCRCYYY